MLKFIKKQKPITLIGVLLLILFIMTLEITGVRAYLFDGDWANNRIKIGECNIRIVEDFDPPKELAPGISFRKNVQVKNEGPSDCYVRVKALLTDSHMEPFIEIDWNTSSWQYDPTDGYYYYIYPLEDGDYTESLLTTVTLIEGDYQAQIKDFDILIYAECYQANGFSSYQEAWDHFEINKPATPDKPALPDAPVTAPPGVTVTLDITGDLSEEDFTDSSFYYRIYTAGSDTGTIQNSRPYGTIFLGGDVWTGTAQMRSDLEDLPTGSYMILVVIPERDGYSIGETYSGISGYEEQVTVDKVGPVYATAFNFEYQEGGSVSINHEINFTTDAEGISDEQPGDEADEQPGDGAGGQSGGESGGQSGGESGGQSGGESGGQSGGETGEQSGGETGEQSGGETGEQSGSETGEQPGGISGEEPSAGE